VFFLPKRSHMRAAGIAKSPIDADESERIRPKKSSLKPRLKIYRLNITP